MQAPAASQNTPEPEPPSTSQAQQEVEQVDQVEREHKVEEKVNPTAADFSNKQQQKRARKNARKHMQQVQQHGVQHAQKHVQQTLQYDRQAKLIKVKMQLQMYRQQKASHQALRSHLKAPGSKLIHPTAKFTAVATWSSWSPAISIWRRNTASTKLDRLNGFFVA